MTPEARHYLNVMRAPQALEPQTLGLWRIERRVAPPIHVMQDAGLKPVGWPDYTVLRRTTMRTLHLDGGGEVVMEDSRRELSQHLPVCMAARGRVLVTGLGLGCVVRGLLANPRVEHVDVVELDEEIISRVWPHVGTDGRAVIHHLDANDVAESLPGLWAYAWHDLFLDDGCLAVAHLQLVAQLRDRVDNPGLLGLGQEDAQGAQSPRRPAARCRLVSERPGTIVSAAAERAKLRESEPTQTPQRRVRNGKPCPLRPCSGVIPKRWVLCEWHWGFVPWRWRVDNCMVSSSSGMGEHALRLSVAVFMVLDQLEAIGTPRPWDAHPHPDAATCAEHTQRIDCSCVWCGPLWKRVRAILSLEYVYWAHILKEYETRVVGR